MNKSLTVTTHLDPMLVAALHRFALSKGINHKSMSALLRDCLETTMKVIKIEPFDTLNEAVEYLQSFGFESATRALQKSSLLQALEQEDDGVSQKEELKKKALSILGG